MTRFEIVDHLEPIRFTGDVDPSERTLVYTIHDGRKIPRHLFDQDPKELLKDPEVADATSRERDWGADLVAEHIARELGLAGILRVELARAVLDYGRFPGSSKPGESYLERHSFYPPFDGLMSESAKHVALERYYDSISRTLTDHFARTRVMLAVHTYDPANASGSERPEVSLVTRGKEYQSTSSIRPGVFDPLFPAILCETTGHRLLTYRILLNLESLGHRAELNYPYVMPDGSLEIRAQVWFFFRHLRGAFEEACPETADSEAYSMVWKMLHDVARRSSSCEHLRGFLHDFRDPPPGQAALFVQCRAAYERIASFLDRHRAELVDVYRHSRDRPSCIGIEIRKDLLVDMDEHHRFAGFRPDAEVVAAEIARGIAPAVRDFLDQPLPQRERPRPVVRPRAAAVG